jgi:FtsP/CotA-like multicopper oxidase with cupredoxin domain
MKLLPAELVAEAGAGHHEGHDHAHEGHAHAHATADGIEWEDDMVEVNRMTTPANMRWKIIDRETGAENKAIDWRFRVGDRVKIRLRNEMAGDHPMHHPFHVHGAGRFLVLSRDEATEPNLVWKTPCGARRGNRRHPARRDQRGTLDGALPHRRAPRERHDVQLRGDRVRIAYVVYPDFTALDLVGSLRGVQSLARRGGALHCALARAGAM